MNSAVTRPAVIIVPGGGYVFTSDREAEPIALKMLGNGCNAFVLRYSVSPSVYPNAILELASAITLIRNNASKWHTNPNQVIVAGFSAGGHLSATLGTGAAAEQLKEHGFDPDLVRPNGMMLGYPVITSGKYGHQDSFKALLGKTYNTGSLLNRLSLESQVDEKTPRTFIWHTITDQLVPVQNSLLFVQACLEHGVPIEAHIYPSGDHGLSLGTAETAWHGHGAVEQCVQSWMQLFISWITREFPNS